MGRKGGLGIEIIWGFVMMIMMVVMLLWWVVLVLVLDRFGLAGGWRGGGGEIGFHFSSVT